MYSVTIDTAGQIATNLTAYEAGQLAVARRGNVVRNATKSARGCFVGFVNERGALLPTNHANADEVATFAAVLSC